MNVSMAVVATSTRGIALGRADSSDCWLIVGSMQWSRDAAGALCSHFWQWMSTPGGCRLRTKGQLWLHVQSIAAAVPQLLRGRTELQLAAVTRADGAQVVVAVDAGGVAVGEIDLNGVVAYRRGGLGFGLGLEHGQHDGCRCCAFGAGQGGFFLAVVVTQSAGAVVAQIDKIVVARVAVSPGDIHACASRDVHLYAARVFPRVDGKWHRFAMRSEEHTSELQSLAYLVCRLLLEKKKNMKITCLD